MAGGIEQGRTFGREGAGCLAGLEHPRKDGGKRPAITLGGHQGLELLHHGGIVLPGGGVHGNHARGVTHAQHLLARELPVHVAGQCGEEGDVAHVLLPVEDALVEMGDAPPQGDVEAEEAGELGCGLARIGVPPGAEGRQHAAVGRKGHVAVHHGTDAERGQRGDFLAIPLLHVLAERGIAVLEPLPYGIEAVGPEAVFQLVLPRVAALGDGVSLIVDEHGLDACGTKFYTQHGLALLDDGLGIGHGSTEGFA